MYSDPLMVLREYLQNSTDSLDLLQTNQNKPKIEIKIDGRNRSLEICDNGIGIPSPKVESTLLNIGASEKTSKIARGFRGIGRLGGLGYCDTLIFTTKAKGERIVTECVWDAKLLRQLVASKEVCDTFFLIDKATNVKSTVYSGSQQDHFFRVKMLNMHDSRNVLVNIPIIRSYVSQVAPVPFLPDFSFGNQINVELTRHVPSYKFYTIILNNVPIYKPYQTSVALSKDSFDTMQDIQFVELFDGNNTLAFGWLGSLNLLGTINPLCRMDGIRLRCGNILLGNKDTLSPLFKETRFNHYLVGELHTVDDRLIPNSRRDDFEDCELKGKLFNEFIKEIGVPNSFQIRELSKKRSLSTNHENTKILFSQAAMVTSNGYLSVHQRDRLISQLNSVNGTHSIQEVMLAKKLSEELLVSQDVLSIQNLSNRPKNEVIDILKTILDILSKEIPRSKSTNKLESKIYSVISDNNHFTK